MRTLVSNLRIPLGALADCVHNYGQYLKANFSRADMSGGNLRLQVLAGKEFARPSWRVWQGDSQFDTDHRGYWGASFVPLGVSRKDSLAIARDLIGQAQESEAMSGDH